MSRLEFRARVAEPRPASAWMMVTVAAATLWITQQLALWALAIQVLAIVGSLTRRRQPHAWQQSPLALNVAMSGITLVTIGLTLEGASTTIALAHFAALTLALKLLDARPRKSEFLLVALSLIHVLLAANLTDSILFPPLLVAFVLSTTWTLLVHTLRTEAIEAHEGHAADRAITPDLLRKTLGATAVAMALAMLIFLVLPRLRAGVLQGAGRGGPGATAGFSDHVRLGELGRIRQDPRVVLRVETLEGDAPSRAQSYWRGLAFDAFDGWHWSVTPLPRRPVPGAPELGVDLVAPRRPADLVQRIVREPVEAGVLFALGEGEHLAGSLRRLQRDVNGGLYAAGQADERIRYTVWTRARRFVDAELEGDRARPPRGMGERYLALPPLDPRVAELARRIAGPATSDAARVRRLEQHLLATGRYTDDPPPLGRRGGASPVEEFLLGRRAGHCEYFASAMVVLARTLGLPARLVNGFAGGRENPIGGFIELAHSDAHAWVEVHYERAGWLRYDPTPPARRLRGESAGSLGERAAQLASALELWWYQSVVGFDRSDQMRALRTAWNTWEGWRTRSAGPVETRPTERAPAWRVPTRIAGRDALLAALALALAVWLWRRRHRHAPRAKLPPPYAAALRLLARRGFVRGPATPARDFARGLEARLPAPAARAFLQLTESYLAQRFGGRPQPGAAAQLARLRRGLGQRRLRAQAPGAGSASTRSRASTSRATSSAGRAASPSRARHSSAWSAPRAGGQPPGGASNAK